MFRLENIRYKDILNIDDLEIPEGKITCIIGKSGSGKTTFTKLLNGLISADSGEVYVKAEPISQLNLIQLRRRVVMLQQTPSIYEGTVRDNLQVGRKFSGLAEATDQEMEEALHDAYLDKDLQTDAYELSGGEKQRLALARILLLNPDVLIMDEPTSALDEDTAHSIMKKVLKKCKDKGQTIIIITHSNTVVDAFADYVIELESGSVVAAKEVNDQ